jgi:hypothetical protein
LIDKKKYYSTWKNALQATLRDKNQVALSHLTCAGFERYKSDRLA